MLEEEELDAAHLNKLWQIVNWEEIEKRYTK